MEQTRRLMPHPFGEQTVILPFGGKKDVCSPKTRAKTVPHAPSLKRVRDLSQSEITFIRSFAEAAGDGDGLRTFETTQVDQLSSFLPQNGKNAVCWTRKRAARPARSRAPRARMKRAAAVPSGAAADWSRTPRACSAPRTPHTTRPAPTRERAPHGTRAKPREPPARIAYALIST